MSISRLTSSHLLAQRLDTLLGTKLAQQLVSSTRPTTQDFIPQTPKAQAVESPAHSPERPPGPLPEAPRQQQQQQQPKLLGNRPAPAPAPGSTERPLSLQPNADLPGTASAPISLGNVAQTLVQLLRQYPSPLPALTQPQALLPEPAAPRVINNPPAATSLTPTVLAFSSPMAGNLFQALEQAINRSGLFYESPLAEFSLGRYSRAQILSEPQARLADTLPAQEGADPAPRIAGIPQEAALTVRQQLETLALHTLQWRGEVWPQATMEWRIARDGRQEDGTFDEQSHHWSSTLTLRLPKLGEIHARLLVVDGMLNIHLAAPQAQEQLRAHADTLRQQMHACGLHLNQLDIHAEFDDEHLQPAGSEQATAPLKPHHE